MSYAKKADIERVAGSKFLEAAVKNRKGDAEEIIATALSNASR